MIATTTYTAIVPLERLTTADEPRSGGKAYNCALLMQAGFPVPDGLVVLSTATDAEVSAVADHPWFDAVPADVLFAVRSSGIGEDGEGESFAGIHQTLLNVSRADLTDAIRQCRASAHATAALEYRRAKGMSTERIEMAVLVQRMILPVAAGVVFTVNPITGATDEIVVNSSWGLGEALVSGQITPDEFGIGKEHGEIRWEQIGDKGDGHASCPSLSPIQLRELATMSDAIEREYGTPQDIEWCHDGSRFWIVQSRPVTTMVAAANEPEWTRANLVEVFPDITSYQALTVYEEMLERAERQYLGSLAAPEDELGPMVKAFHGRLYFNLTQFRRICELSATAPAVILKSMGHAEAIEPSDEVTPRPTLQTLKHLPAFIRMLWRHTRAESVIRRHEVRTAAHLKEFSTDPHPLSDAGIWARVERWCDAAPEYMQPVLVLGGVTFHEAPVWKACAQVGFSFEDLVYPQLAAGERSVSAQQAFDLVHLADIARDEPHVRALLQSDPIPSLAELREALQGTAFLSAFESFLEEYGHRGLHEYDWSLPRYHEDPTPLLLTLRAHLTDGSAGQDRNGQASPDEAAARAWAAFESRLSPKQRRTVLPTVRRSVRRIKQYYVWREQVRSDLVRVLSAVRPWHLVLAGRFVERGWLDNRDDYFELLFSEVGEIIRGERDPGTLRGIVAGRISQRERNRAIQMPLLMRASLLPALIRANGLADAIADGEDLTGQPVSGGCIEAEVVIVRSPADFSRMKRGAILVAPATDPSWTPLFTLASGVIVEIGGILSHASTIAREYGLPALANVKGATRRLKTGERVRLDAVSGRVYRLEPNAVEEDAA